LILLSEEPSLQELETDSGKDIAAASKVEDVTAANTIEDIVAADLAKDVTAACYVSVNAEEVAADSVRDILLFEGMSEEPLPPELKADNVKELVALSESTLLMSLNSYCITCTLPSTRASDILQPPQSVREHAPLSNPVRGPFALACSWT
jgi:regulator of RNase E activity RraB